MGHECVLEFGQIVPDVRHGRKDEEKFITLYIQMLYYKLQL
jgi:hypothetical protein